MGSGRKKEIAIEGTDSPLKMACQGAFTDDSGGVLLKINNKEDVWPDLKDFSSPNTPE